MNEQAARDRALLVAMHITHSTPWDSLRYVARLLVHHDDVTRENEERDASVVGGDAPEAWHPDDCPTCAEVDRVIPALRAALDSFDRTRLT